MLSVRLARHAALGLGLRAGRLSVQVALVPARATARRASSLVDSVLDGPLPERIGQELASHDIARRVMTPMITQLDLEQIVRAALADESTRRIVEEGLDSPLTDAVVGHIAGSPQLRAAIAQQGTGLADEMAATVRHRAQRLDDGVERSVRGWLRRPPQETA